MPKKQAGFVRNYQQKVYVRLLLVCMVICFVDCHSQCVHDEMIASTTKHFYNDLHSSARLLQTEEIAPLRIFADYSQLTVGGVEEINLIKRIVNITALYFSKTLKVKRLSRLFFPENISRLCNVLTVPQIYVTEGAIGDTGFIVGNENKPQAIYTAKSAACAFLQSNKRSIWGVMIFNNAFLKYDSYGFQQILFVGVKFFKYQQIHEATHILGFSAQMYETYATGNPLKNQTKGEYSDYYLDSQPIRRQVLNHYNCDSKGLLLQDQDGTLIGSHIERKIIGNQFMIAQGKKNAFISSITLAVLQSTGWYPEVNYSMAEPTVWGRQKGCDFLNIDDCTGNQFCQGSGFGCELDHSSMGRCQPDGLTGTCRTMKYFTNTICIDENFQLKNLNAALNTLERGGDSSRCFNSDFREPGKNATALNNRCYVSVCSSNSRYIYVLVGSSILVCRVPSQVINAPLGLEGVLTCPSDFRNLCQSKKTCPYHCSKNGACINGRCLCTNETQLTSTCLDVAFTINQVGTTSASTTSASTTSSSSTSSSTGSTGTQVFSLVDGTVPLVDKKCFVGYVYDPAFGECLKCSEMFGCVNCNANGCLRCDRPNIKPVNGTC